MEVNNTTDYREIRLGTYAWDSDKKYGDDRREEIKKKPGCNSNHLERMN